MMSSELSALAPLCQAALITFHPVNTLIKGLLLLIVGIALLKLMASLAKTAITVHKLTLNAHLPLFLRPLLRRYHLSTDHFFIISESKLLAFTLFVPFQLRNGIFLSRGMLTQLSAKQTEAVFLHELYHWRKKDPLVQLILSIIGPALFFVPSLRDLIAHWQLQAEVNADAFVVREQGTSRFLKKALSTWVTTPDLVPAWASAFSSTSFERRIAALDSHSVTLDYSVRRLTATCLIIAGLVITLATLSQKVSATVTLPTAPQCQQLLQSQDQKMSTNQSLNVISASN